MDLINGQLERIKTQLAGLTLTQRMLVGTLVALMAITIYYWGHYAGNPEMVPVLDGQLSSADMTTVEHALQAQGISYVPSGSQILVPADRKMDIVANLAYGNELPHDSSATFQAIMKDLSPFSPSEDRDLHFTQYQQQALEQMIRRFPEVADVSVMINAKEEYRIDGSLVPSATVNITTRSAPAGSKTFHKLVEASAGAVASAVGVGMTPGHVTVIVDGRKGSGTDDSDSNIGGSDLVELAQNFEEEKEKAIREEFSDIIGLNVMVACDVQNSTTNVHKTAYDAKTTLSKPIQEDQKDQESHNTGGTGGEPGVGANTSATIATAGGGGGSGSEMTSSESKTTNQIMPGMEDTSVSTPAGKPSVTSAALRVPRSYFIAICKKTANGPDPTDAEVTKAATDEMANMRELVTNILHIAPEMVSVKMYTDSAPMMAMASGPALVSGGGAGLLAVTGHAKEIGVLALAVLSLFMMSSMVRKSAPAPVMLDEAASAESGPSVLGGGEVLAGEVGASETTLDGMELDDDAVRAQQMLDQVTTMVKDNPDSAAVLVKRWLNRS
jgi:flagellar biosynthesis/type III secretory pathway M-ring protein FliF/YscJ